MEELAGLGAAVGQFAFDTLGNYIGYRWTQEANHQNYLYWKEMQEYNSPKNQMMRLRMAGLNPNLMYGQGTTGNVNSMPTAQVPTYNPTNLIHAVTSMISAINQTKATNIQAERASIYGNISESTIARNNQTINNLKVLAHTNRLKAMVYEAVEGISRDEHGNPHIADITKNYSVRLSEEKLNRLTADISRIMTNTELMEKTLAIQDKELRLKELEVLLAEHLRPLGLTSSDPAWIRLLILSWDGIVAQLKSITPGKIKNTMKDFWKYRVLAQPGWNLKQ